jgi:hypothetical protein
MNKKIRFYVFGYRNQDFWFSYGPIVRDLMFCEELSRCDSVDSIMFFNRPKNLIEIILNKRPLRSGTIDLDKIQFVNSFSIDIFGILKKRLWNKNIFKRHYKSVSLDNKYINVVLDFLPIGDLPDWTNNADLIWYDYIDNFAKHNRYSNREIQAVKNKYDKIKDSSNYIFTGVSSGISEINQNVEVIPNAVLNAEEFSNLSSERFEFDFGFMGFVTDKFDIGIVKYLATKGYKIAIYGEFYDSSIENSLNNIDNISLFGKFNGGDVRKILSSFRIGLIPYKRDLLHDESPLKLYQYLCASKCVLSSSDFNFYHERFFVYNSDNLNEILPKLDEESFRAYSISKSDIDSFTWKGRIDLVMRLIENKIGVI